MICSINISDHMYFMKLCACIFHVFSNVSLPTYAKPHAHLHAQNLSHLGKWQQLINCPPIIHYLHQYADMVAHFFQMFRNQFFYQMKAAISYLHLPVPSIFAAFIQHYHALICRFHQILNTWLCGMKAGTIVLSADVDGGLGYLEGPLDQGFGGGNLAFLTIWFGAVDMVCPPLLPLHSSITPLRIGLVLSNAFGLTFELLLMLQRSIARDLMITSEKSYC